MPHTSGDYPHTMHSFRTKANQLPRPRGHPKRDRKWWFTVMNVKVSAVETVVKHHTTRDTPVKYTIQIKACIVDKK